VNTLLIYMSDFGPWAPYLDQGGSSGLLRGAKGSTWEGGMRVPAIFWWPGTIKSSVTTGIGSELDILQTFANLAGAQAPSDRVLDGYDLSETLRGRAPSPRHTLFYYANSGNGILSAVRRDSFKAFFVVPSADAAGTSAAAASLPQLYNLDQDPSEKFDVAEKHPELMIELRKLADEHQKTVVAVKNQIATRTQGRGSRP
jgi:arylsulfatase A